VPPASSRFTAEASFRISELAASGGPPENKPSSRASVLKVNTEQESISPTWGAVEDVANRRIQNLERLVTSFANEYQNSCPEVVKVALPIFHQLRDAILKGGS